MLQIFWTCACHFVGFPEEAPVSHPCFDGVLTTAEARGNFPTDGCHVLCIFTHVFHDGLLVIGARVRLWQKQLGPSVNPARPVGGFFAPQFALFPQLFTQHACSTMCSVFSSLTRRSSDCVFCQRRRACHGTDSARKCEECAL